MQLREELRVDSMCPRDGGGWGVGVGGGGGGGGGTVDGEGGAHCVSK